MGEVIAFAGPTLPPGAREEWAELLEGVDLRPPVRRGDVFAALADEPHTLVVIDGYYYTEPAVSHKELLYALDAGVRVIGSASLGALRAAEMAPLGMIGVGEVFAWYRDGILDGDDEVAVLHAAEEHGFRSLTYALVDLRFSLETMIERGYLGRGDAERLVASQKELAFFERCPEALGERAEQILPEGCAEALRSDLRGGGIKRRDALQALELARTPYRRKSQSSRRRTAHFSCDRESLVPARKPPGAPAARQICWAVQLLHPSAAEWVRRLHLRYLLSSAVDPEDGVPSKKAVGDLVESLTERLRVSSSAGLRALPRSELWAEARCQARADLAVSRWGAQGAGRRVAERFGLSSLEELLPLFRQQQVYFPTWWIVRALALTSAFASASEVAEAALGIARIFRETRGNEQIRRSELEAVAGTIWGCEPERTVREGRRRGLFENDGYSPGLWQALEMLAPAERARTPLAGYAGKRAALIAVTLHDPLGKTLPPLPPLPPIGAKSGVFRRTLPSEGPARSTEPGHLSASNASSSGEIP